MAKIFGTNILRSFIITAIAILIAGGINIGVNYLCVRLIGVTSAPFWLFGVITILISGSIMGAVSKWGQDSEIIFPKIMQTKDSKWLKLIENGKKIKWSQIKLSLLPHLLIGIVMVAVIVLRLSHWVDVTENPPKNPLLNGSLYGVTAVVAVMVTQFGYYFAYKSRYRETRCDKCRHVLCLVKIGVCGVDNSQEIELQEKNESHYVEWESDGKIYGGISGTKMRTRAVTTKTTFFNCSCVICGNEQLHSEKTGKEEGEWSEWH